MLDDAIAFVQSNPNHQVYDTNIDRFNSVPPAHRSGIIVTKISTINKEDLNQRQRSLTILGALACCAHRVDIIVAGPERLLQVGEFVEDPANNLRITVQSLATSSTNSSSAFPARYTVRVQWTSVRLS